MPTKPKIAIIIGSTRPTRFADKAAQWILKQAQARDDIDVEIVDLRDHPLPFFDGRAPAHAKRDYPTPEVARFGQTIDRADGFVIVTPEYISCSAQGPVSGERGRAAVG